MAVDFSDHRDRFQVEIRAGFCLHEAWARAFAERCNVKADGLLRSPNESLDWQLRVYPGPIEDIGDDLLTNEVILNLVGRKARARKRHPREVLRALERFLPNDEEWDALLEREDAVHLNRKFGF